MARGPLAGASGPGKFAKRTDGLSAPSQYYGEGVETASIKRGAAMAKTPDVRGARASDVRAAAAGAAVTPLFAETQRRDEPITSGIDMGDGPGPEALGVAPQMQAQDEDDIRFRAAIKDYMPVLSYIAQRPDTSPETRKVIRQLRDSL